MPSVIVAIGSIVISTVGAAVSTSLGLALASAGAMAVGAATVIGGLMLANKAISSLYEMPKVDTDASRQRTVKGTIEPQKILYGENLVSGPISFVGTYGDTNRVLAHAVVLASHEVEEITNIYFDEEIITDSQIDVNGYVTSGKFGPVGNKTFNFNGTNFGTNICKINRYTGASGQTADADLVANFFSYTSNHIGTGLAYVTTHWLLKDGSQKTWDQYAPRDIKAIVKGRKVYDPRTDTIAYSDNPALCLADYLTNTDFGMSIASAKIDWDSVSDAADACDVTVSVPSATEKRFTCNGVLFGTDSHKTNINKILSSMNGLMSFTNGKFVIRAGVYEAPAVSLNEDHLAGAVSVKTSFERSDRFNTVTGTFIDPAQNYKATEFPEVQITAALLRDNSEVLTKDIQLPMTNSSYMAQRIAHKLVQISDQQKVVTFPTNLAGMQIAIGDRVSVSLEEFNWTNKVFICLGWTFSDSGNGGVSLILREDDAGSYADPLVGEYSTISATGGIITGFRGYPDPQNLSATAGLKSIELNWDNPDNMKDIEEIEVFASPNSSWASAVKIGAVKGTQFKHDESNTVDSVVVGDQRWYWVRARGYSFGDTDDAVSDRNPDNDTSGITATVGVIPWADVDGDDKPEDNATVGATVGTDLYDTDGTTVLGGADVLNEVLEQQILNVQIETGEVLDLETGQDVIIQNLGDVAIYVNESNQIINSSIGSLSTAFSNLENTLVDLTSGVSDVYVQATAPVAGVGGIPDPIPTFSRWYDSDDSNEPYYWDGTQWVSLADPRIASNASSIVTLQSGLNTANSNISANSSAISVLDATTISQGNSIASLSSDVTTLQSDLTTAEGDIVTNASAISGLTTRVTTAEGEITSQASDITTLETTVNDPTTGVSANATAISGLDTRVTANETSITSQASQTTALNASLSDLIYIQDEADSILETETGEELLLNLATNVATATSEIVETLDSRVVATEQGIVAQSQAITALQSELTTLDGEQSATADAVTVLTTRVSDTESGILANASSISSLTATVGTNTANITEINDVSVTSTSAIAQYVAGLNATVQGNSANISEINTVSASSDSAIARAVNSLNVTVGEDTVTLQEVKSVTDGVSAQYSVTIDNNGYVTGFGLVSDIIDGNPTSAFIVNADQFAVGGAGSASTTSPFVVYTTSQTVVKDGVSVTIPAGVYIGDAFIQSAAIGRVKIADGAINAEKIEAESIASAVITAGSIVVSGDDVSGLNNDSGYVADGDTDVDLSLTAGAAGPVTITSTSLYQGDGTYNNINTGFYLDSLGQFSLRDKLSFDGTNLSVSGSVTASAFTLSSGATLVDPSDQVSNANNNAFFRYETTASGDDVSAPSNAQFEAAFGRNPRPQDALIVINITSDPNVSAAYVYSGTAWVSKDNFITGDLIVDGTIFAEKISVDEISSITSNLGSITGGSININNAFTVTSVGGLTATSANITGNITAQNLDISSATVTGTLSADAIQIDNVTLDTDESGNLIIKDSGVTAGKVATDAIGARQLDISADNDEQANSVYVDPLGTIKIYDSNSTLRVKIGNLSA
jgi:predicted  nucleic acid-binding Zn-ribbon protein